MSEYLNKRTQRQILAANEMENVALRVLNAKEERLAKANEKQGLDLSVLNFSPSERKRKHQEEVSRLNEDSAKQFAKDLSESLGVVVARASKIDDGFDRQLNTQIAKSTSEVFLKLMKSGSLNFNSINYKDTPHTALYIDSLREVADHKVRVAANECVQDDELLKSNEKVIHDFEVSLAECINAKMNFMLENEKQINEKINADKIAAESMQFPEVFLRKQEKSYNSYFRKIMNMHAGQAINALESDGTFDEEKIYSEAIITYNILEVLHTTKFAPKADLTWKF